MTSLDIILGGLALACGGGLAWVCRSLRQAQAALAEKSATADALFAHGQESARMLEQSMASARAAAGPCSMP